MNKIIKLTMVLVFFFLPFLLFSEIYPSYLESNDIRIFINGIEDIWKEKMSIDSQSNDLIEKYWYEFGRQRMMLNNWKAFGFSKFPYDTFEETINYTAPTEIEEMYRNVGWEFDGHKKFWTIYYYFTFIKICKDYEDPNSEIRHTWRWLDNTGKIFDRQYNLNNTEDYYNQENKMTIQSKEDYADFMEKLSKNDIEIILSNWKELCSVPQLNKTTSP